MEVVVVAMLHIRQLVQVSCSVPISPFAYTLSVGIMVVLGWRRAYDTNPWGLYDMPPDVRKDPIKRAAWLEYARKMKRIQVSSSKDVT